MKIRRFLSALLAAVLLAGVLPTSALAAPARSGLSAKDQKVYDMLRTEVGRVLSGTSASTIFSLTFEGFQSVWTASELGVKSIVSGDGIALDAAEALADRMAAFCTDDPQKILLALLADLPYDLYWYDKTAQTGYGLDLGYPAFRASMNEDEEWILYPSAYDPDHPTDRVPVTYQFQLPVSGDYGYAHLFTGKRKSVGSAQSIVAKYAGKSDYEKLLGYAAEICELTDYDKNSSGSKYGDRWQVTNVFDGDKSTKVLCEGYAKAFKYLCDLTKFDSNRIECRLVSGLMQSVPGENGRVTSGSHMWNIVTMDDGRNYLVDVTNSDMNGGPEFLSLKGGVPVYGVYTFQDYFTYTYDEQTKKVWSTLDLVLATEDYKRPAQTAPAKETPKSEPSGTKQQNAAPAGSAPSVTVGQVVGQVLSTDIRAYVNGAEIPAYNIDGRLAVLVSDLNRYGFVTSYDNSLRKTTVKRDRNAKAFSSVPSAASGLPVGSPVMSVYSTDIVVEMDGRRVEAFNVDNRMAIYFSELKEYGTYGYDNAARASSVTLYN